MTDIEMKKQPTPVDPLDDSVEAATVATSDTNNTMVSCHTIEEYRQVLQEKQMVDMNAEDMDPLEWTFRKLVPIPKHYYWNVVPPPSSSMSETTTTTTAEEAVAVAQSTQVPFRIQIWHHSLYTLSCMSQWMNESIGQPLIRTLGLNTPRVNDVTMFMSEQDWKQSKRIVMERQNTMSGLEQE